MIENTLLFCNPLSDSNADWLRKQAGIPVKIVPLIEFQNIPISEWLLSISPEKKTWIFTSKRAAKAVLAVFDELPKPDQIFCVGPTTASYFKHLKIPIILPETYHSVGLVKALIAKKIKNAIHFRGNLSSHDLVNDLAKNGVEVNGVTVYNTVKVPQRVATDNVAGMVFMSPSAIEAFVEQNIVTPNIRAFCIGETTGSAAKKMGFEQVIIPENYSLEALLTTIKNFVNE